jgi:RNA polymerase sigma-70 factor (sigma-E family)
MRREAGHERDAEFTAFVEACGGRLFHTAELLTGDPHRAADLVQSSLERAYLRWGRIQADDPTAYVRRIMVNSQRDWWRRVRVREWLTADPPDAATPRDLATDASQRAYVLGALARLTPRERTVVVLRFYADLSEAAIATEVGIALGTVKSTLARALGKLRALPEFSPQTPGRMEAEQ